jgi:hypothetical protein
MVSGMSDDALHREIPGGPRNIKTMLIYREKGSEPKDTTGHPPAPLPEPDARTKEQHRKNALSKLSLIGEIVIVDVLPFLSDAKNAARSECSICVVGNKSDLKDSRVIKYNDGAKFCQENSN